MHLARRAMAPVMPREGPGGMSGQRHPLDREVWTRDLVDNLAVRKLLGRKLRTDRKPITRHTLLAWRAKEADFPKPMNAPGVSVELWSRRDVRAWLAWRLAQNQPLEE